MLPTTTIPAQSSNESPVTRPRLAGVRRFIQAYAWIVRTHLLVHKALVARIVAMSAGGAIAQGGTIAFIAFAVEFFESPRETGPFGLDVLAGRPRLTLAVFGVCLLAIVLAGAWATYTAMVGTRALARSFHERCAVETIQTFSRVTALDHSGMPDSMSTFRRIVVRDARQMGKAVETLVRGLDPVFRLVVALGLLVWIDARLCLLLLPLIVVLAPLLHRMFTSIQKDSRRFYERLIADMQPGVRGIVTGVSQDNLPGVPERDDVLRARYTSDTDIRRYFDDFDRLILAQDRVQLATSISASTMLVVALLGGGYLATAGHLSWAKVMAFLLALWQLVSALRGVQGGLTNLSVFYPAIRRVRLFGTVRTPDESPQRRNAKPFSKPITIECCGELPGSVPHLELRPGEPVLCVTEHALDRIGVQQIVAPLRAAGSAPKRFWTRQTCFIGAKAALTEGRLGDLVAEGSRDDRGHEAFRAWLDALSLSVEMERAALDLDAVMTAERWEGLSASLRLALLVGVILRDDRRLLLIDARLLVRPERRIAAALLEQLSNRYVLIVTSGQTVPKTLAQAALVLHNDSVAGAGSVEWFDGIREQLAWRSRETDGDLDDEEDELDE